MKEMKCSLCHKQVFSSIGKGCKFCGMVLEDEGREFCSGECRQSYHKINRNLNKRISLVYSEKKVI